MEKRESRMDDRRWFFENQGREKGLTEVGERVTYPSYLHLRKATIIGRRREEKGGRDDHGGSDVSNYPINIGISYRISPFVQS